MKQRKRKVEEEIERRKLQNRRSGGRGEEGRQEEDESHPGFLIEGVEKGVYNRNSRKGERRGEEIE
jgi:hypothetical protein